MKELLWHRWAFLDQKHIKASYVEGAWQGEDAPLKSVQLLLSSKNFSQLRSLLFSFDQAQQIMLNFG
jgi:hypothetical protein